MVQLIALAAIGAVAYVGYSSFRKHMDELNAKDAVQKDREAKVVGELKKDPKTGRYRLDD